MKSRIKKPKKLFSSGEIPTISITDYTHFINYEASWLKMEICHVLALVKSVIDADDVPGIRSLVQLGIDMNYRNRRLIKHKYSDLEVSSFFTYAIFEDKLTITRALIELKADVNNSESDGNSPLHYARSNAMIELLLDHHAKINQKNSKGFTPLLQLVFPLPLVPTVPTINFPSHPPQLIFTSHKADADYVDSIPPDDDLASFPPLTAAVSPFTEVETAEPSPTMKNNSSNFQLAAMRGLLRNGETLKALLDEYKIDFLNCKDEKFYNKINKLQPIFFGAGFLIPPIDMWDKISYISSYLNFKNQLPDFSKETKAIIFKQGLEPKLEILNLPEAILLIVIEYAVDFNNDFYPFFFIRQFVDNMLSDKQTQTFQQFDEELARHIKTTNPEIPDLDFKKEDNRIIPYLNTLKPYFLIPFKKLIVNIHTTLANSNKEKIICEQLIKMIDQFLNPECRIWGVSWMLQSFIDRLKFNKREEFFKSVSQEFLTQLKTAFSTQLIWLQHQEANLIGELLTSLFNPEEKERPAERIPNIRTFYKQHKFTSLIKELEFFGEINAKQLIYMTLAPIIPDNLLIIMSGYYSTDDEFSKTFIPETNKKLSELKSEIFSELLKESKSISQPQNSTMNSFQQITDFFQFNLDNQVWLPSNPIKIAIIVLFRKLDFSDKAQIKSEVIRFIRKFLSFFFNPYILDQILSHNIQNSIQNALSLPLIPPLPVTAASSSSSSISCFAPRTQSKPKSLVTDDKVQITEGPILFPSPKTNKRRIKSIETSENLEAKQKNQKMAPSPATLDPAP